MDAKEEANNLMEKIKKEQDLINQSFDDGVLLVDDSCVKCGKSPCIEFGATPICQEHANNYIKNKRIMEAMQRLNSSEDE